MKQVQISWLQELELKSLEELKKNFENIKILKFDISQSDKIEEFIENATSELGGSLDGL